MNLFFALALILCSAKLLGAAAKQFDIPAVVGELLAGIIIGPSVLNWIQPSHVLEIIADLAVILLLFEVGLDTNFKQFKKVGKPGAKVAVVGFLLPLILAFPLNYYIFHLDFFTALFIAGALTATSIGITVRVLANMQKQHSREAHIVIAAAVFDDILGVLLLVFLLNMSGTGAESLTSAVKTGLLLLAFAAGLVLSQNRWFKQTVSRRCHGAIEVITPVFFVMVGVSINLQAIAWHSPFIWLFSLSLFALAFIGKFLAGFAVKEVKALQIIIGLSMMPRGEVGLIFAQLGLQGQILNLPEYTALVLVVVATTFLAPFLLKWRYRRLLPSVIH